MSENDGSKEEKALNTRNPNTVDPETLNKEDKPKPANNPKDT